jgi:hypothetical protein
LKHYLLYFFLFNFGLSSSAQNLHLQLTGSSISETKIVDSLSYLSKHKNAKSISDEIELTSDKLSKIGFLENKIITTTKINDSSYNAKLHLGGRIKSIHIYIGTNLILRTLLFPTIIKDTIVLSYGETESFLNQSLKKLDEKGYAFAKLNLTKIQPKGTKLFATLEFEAKNQRKLNSIVVKYSKMAENKDFPKGHLAQINRRYKNKIFNSKLVTQIHDEFEKYEFITQVKYPEILFTKDTTKVYVYIEKVNTNTFDGFIGFNNNDNNKITFNGYLDLTLQNIIKAGEQFSLNWKSDGNKQKIFKTAIELPYILKSPIGLRGQLSIFKQDSTFQNTKTAVDLSYYLNYDTRIYLGYQSTISSDIQNTNDAFITDYKNSYLTSELNYSILDNHSPLFLKKSEFNIKTGVGKREVNDITEKPLKNQQFYIDLSAMHTLYLNKKNTINIRSQNYYLQSTNYLTNELFRFGGINSIRGFTENSLQANFMTAVLTEYRYLASPTLYFNTIIDYSLFKDSSLITVNNDKTTLVGLGLGLGVKTKNGLLKISMATGSTNNKQLEFSNTIIHLSYGVKF